MDALPTHQPAETASAVAAPRRRGHFLSHLFSVLFCLEVGFVLFLMPWTVLWDTNYFFSIAPELNRVWLSTYLRGAVSGVGLVNLWIGLGEAWRLRRA